MRPELEQRLVRRWPEWFRVDGDIRHTLMPLGFQNGDGWFGIVWRLCEELEPLAAEAEREAREPFEVLQVKEKFGGLRFYVNHKTEAIVKRIEAAETEALRICEICGQPGRWREDGWIRTRCDGHSDAREAATQWRRKVR